MSGTHTPLQSGSRASEIQASAPVAAVLGCDDGRTHVEASTAAHTNNAYLRPILVPANVLTSPTGREGKFAQATADASSARYSQHEAIAGFRVRSERYRLGTRGRWLWHCLRQRLGVCVFDARPVDLTVSCGADRWLDVGAMAAGDNRCRRAGNDVRHRQRQASAEPGALCRRRTATASIQ